MYTQEKECQCLRTGFLSESTFSCAKYGYYYISTEKICQEFQMKHQHAILGKVKMLDKHNWIQRNLICITSLKRLGGKINNQGSFLYKVLETSWDKCQVDFKTQVQSLSLCGYIPLKVRKGGLWILTLRRTTSETCLSREFWLTMSRDKSMGA